MGILQATHLRRARSRGLLLGRPPIQHSYQSSGLETPPSVNDRWIRWRDPKQLRRTFVDTTDKSLKQEPLRVVYGIPSAYNAIFSRSVCKRALQIIRQEPSRTSESFPKKSPKNLEDDIFNLFMKGPLKKKMSGSSQKDSTTSTISRPTSSCKGFQENITARFLSLHL